MLVAPSRSNLLCAASPLHDRSTPTRPACCHAPSSPAATLSLSPVKSNGRSVPNSMPYRSRPQVSLPTSAAATLTAAAVLTSYLHCQHGHLKLQHLWCPPSPHYGPATAKTFEQDPQQATQRLLHQHRPRRVVAYDHPALNDVLEASDYTRELRTFHAHVLQSEHEARFMCVWQWTG